MKIALVSAPFDSVSRPNLALSILKSALVEAGHSARVIYGGLSFAKMIGITNYTLIAERFPTSMALGDAVYSLAAFDNTINWQQYTDDACLDDESESSTRLQVEEFLPRLSRSALEWTQGFANHPTWQDVELVGINATFNLVPALAIARWIKTAFPSIKIILGGAQCEGELGLGIVENFQWIDFVCVGEGERLIVDLASRQLKNTKSYYGLQGLCWRTSGGRAIQNGQRSIEVNLNDSPLPDFSDWLQQRDDNLIFDDGAGISIPIETSRGCWFGEKSHCTFCGLNGESLRFRERSRSAAMIQIENALSTGIKRIFAVDNILPMSYFDTFLKDLEERKSSRPELFYEVKANLSRRHCESLRNANVLSVQPGIENLSSQILRLMRKGTTGFQNIRLLKYAAQIGINVVWNFLYGFPNEDPEEYARQAKIIPLIQHLQPPISAGSRVRMDRFSPLYFDAHELGVSKITPSLAYNHIYPYPANVIDQLAIFFKFEGAFLGNPAHYTESVRSSIANWRNRAGQVALVAIARDEKTYVYDDRDLGSEKKIELKGLQNQLLKLCEDGATIRYLDQSVTDVTSIELREELEKLEGMGIILPLDGKYLSLPIFVDADMMGKIPFELQLDLWASMYKRDMRKLLAHQSTYLLDGKALNHEGAR